MPDKSNQHELLANLAQDYYLSQLSLAELSEKYHLSRYLINKYLDDARREGIVTINIAAPNPRNLELEKTFQKEFAIPHIYILKDNISPTETIDNVLNYAAHQLAPMISQSKIVGLTWGGTIFNIINYFPASVLENVTFTQFIGENMKYKSAAGSMRMVELAAAKFSAEYLTMTGPLYIIDDNVRNTMAQEIAVKPAFEAARKMDLLFTALGTLSSLDSIPTWQENRSAILEDVNPDEIAGMLYGRPYDKNGQFLTSEHDKVFGLSIPEILATPRRFGVVKSKFKTQAALGALRGNLLTDLVTTESIARRILSDAQQDK
ncbi:DNA-binding transcriptional regulator LsrR (DeoR family) [Weissella uvarum]|uniref:sugar-binding transcriptional regulator n=1 Tax=Weissella uvarum TaxID=1479233 RepID=UPI00195FE81E|nr:sugar-binding domain-containing protein [Weissella uvarum]MBM7617029.1 DNA-binding transcriptional regulator LsrR (DeoR family) [Weissella uvarum]MCM0595327.1 sugar-binding transcriptional regulator [Weissella uvarum]